MGVAVRTRPFHVEVLERRVLLTTTLSESEANNTAATADPIPLSADRTVVNAAIGSGTDIDYFSFNVPVRSGVFLDVDSVEAGLSTSLDTVLTLFNASGSTNLGSNDFGFDFDSIPIPIPASGGTGNEFPADAALYVDLNAGNYVVRVSSKTSITGTYRLDAWSDSVYTNAPPVLNSLPGSGDTLYLDFDGHASSTDIWAMNRGAYSIPAFDFNGNPNEWTPAERMAVRRTWQVVAEDFSPFDVNVTTVAPPSFGDGQAYRCVIGNTDGTPVGYGPGSGAIGVSYPDSYGASGPIGKTCFVFANAIGAAQGGQSGQAGRKAIAMGNTASHELGHALGLRHYGSATSSGAIMHFVGGGLLRLRWHAGDTRPEEPPVVFQNDALTIASQRNTISVRRDEAGDSLSEAADLYPSAADPRRITTTAVVGVRTMTSTNNPPRDVDFYRIGAAGATTITVDCPHEEAANLDAVLSLYDVSGRLLASHDPADSLSATITRTLASGAYYVGVRATEPRIGGPRLMGQYNLTITTAAASAAPGMPDLAAASDTGVSNTDNITNLNNNSTARRLTFTVTGTTPGASVVLTANGNQIGVATATGATTTVVTSGQLAQALAEGPNVITARQFESGKPPSAPSVAATVTVDTVAPGVTAVEHLWPPPEGFAATVPHRLAYTFDEGIAPPGADDLTVQAVYGALQAVAVTGVTYTHIPRRAIFSLGFLGGQNSFRATLSAAGVTDVAGNALGGGGHVFYFHVLSGDVNGDGRVDSSDFSILAANFGRSGMSRGQGNLDQFGRVDSSDFALLAGNFGKTTQSVATAAAAQSVSVAPAARVAPPPAKRVVPPPARRKPAPRRAKLGSAEYHPAP